MRSSEAAGSFPFTSTASALVTDSSPRNRWRKMASTSLTRDREALPNRLSRWARSMFSCADAARSQWARRVLVSDKTAQDLMILEEYVADAAPSPFAGDVRTGG